MRSSHSYFVLPRIYVDFCNIALKVSFEIYGVYWQSELRIHFCLTSPSKGSTMFLYQAYVCDEIDSKRR